MPQLRWIRGVLAVLLALGSLTGAAAAKPACGDSNGDGRLNVADLRLDLRCIGGRSVCSARCDVTADGVCSFRDAHQKLRYLRGRLGDGELRCAAPRGPTSFVSADVEQNLRAGDAGVSLLSLASASDASLASEAEREVQEGDIYRVLAGQRILNLNAYRGLQVIDFRDVEQPRIVGRLQISGTPVEMYVVGERAFVLLDDWQGYYGRPHARLEDLELRQGGLLLAVDLSDPSALRVLDEAPLPGSIRASRLTRVGERAAVYVASTVSDWRVQPSGDRVWESRTRVTSFDVSSGALSKQGELDLGGNVAAVQATPEALLVARSEGPWNAPRSRVSILDIRDPGGTLGAGGEVSLEGRVENQFNLDLFRGILRVVSEANGTNHVATFDARDLGSLAPIDRESFGAGERLFATLFLGNKAFFVTYRVVDPFHAFEIGDDGSITAKSEFVVSGWNDFFRAVFDARRLVGIGVNDERGRRLAVSLYDVTDLSNPQPLIARAEVEADHSWSEASFDHRAFSVLENAVAAPGPGGVTETGLVLLPFQGFDSALGRYSAAVQIFTISETTLTRRASMQHGTPVRRSFQPERDITANLSEDELSFFDVADPDRPQELGRVELAPNYTQLLLFGDYAARVKDGEAHFGFPLGDRAAAPAVVEIIPRDAEPDTAAPVARFEIPGAAQTYRVGRSFVTVSAVLVDASRWPYTYRTDISVWDLRDPRFPSRAGTLSTDRLQPGYGYRPGPRLALSTLAWPISWLGSYEALPVRSGLVFVQRHAESEFLGREPFCAGASAETRTCFDYDRYRYWQRLTLEVLDLSDPSAPAFAESLVLPQREDGVSALVEGPDARRLWLTTREPFAVAGDARPHARYFIREIQLANPAAPRAGDPINVPGELIAVDRTSIYTRDAVWGERLAETAVVRLELFEGRAYQQAKHVFEGEFVDAVLLDGAGHVLVSHAPSPSLYRPVVPQLYADFYHPLPYESRNLSVLDAEKLEVLSRVEVDGFASLRDARAGRALFQVPGGVLIVNLDDPAAPFAQAFFPTQGFPRQILVDRRDILIPAGRYGIHRFDLDAFNLGAPGT